MATQSLTKKIERPVLTFNQGETDRLKTEEALQILAPLALEFVKYSIVFLYSRIFMVIGIHDAFDLMTRTMHVVLGLSVKCSFLSRFWLHTRPQL